MAEAMFGGGSAVGSVTSIHRVGDNNLDRGRSNSMASGGSNSIRQKIASRLQEKLRRTSTKRAEHLGIAKMNTLDKVENTTIEEGNSDDEQTVLEGMLNRIPDQESAQGEAKWDFLGITDVDEEEESKQPAAGQNTAVSSNLYV